MAGIRFSISDWAVWTPTRTPEDRSPHQVTELSLDMVPAMLRRRLSPPGKIAVSVCSGLISSQPELPLVFCSRHGEIQRSLEILSDLIAGDSPSPMSFSLSVHNAISGILSIATNNTSPITAIAAGPHAIANALTEAAMILAESESEQVLCVIHDAPLPELYHGTGIGPETPYAIALLLQPASDEVFSIDFGQQSSEETSILQQIEALGELLLGERQQLALASATLRRQVAVP